jgi:ATP-dependent 26S proteasome regulatory subunit
MENPAIQALRDALAISPDNIPLRRHLVYRAYGKAAGGGILMYGPPGCGKNHPAPATAGEVTARSPVGCP